MSLNSAIQTILDSKAFVTAYWIEIEGIPYAYGDFYQTASWFTSRGTATDRFLGIRKSLKEIPGGITQTIDTLQGGVLSSAQVQFKLVDIDGQPTAWTNLDTPSTSLLTAVAVGDTSITPVDAGTFNAGDYCYIGTETIKIGAIAAGVFTGCTRGCFRSTPQAFGAGFPVGTVPNCMAGRRVWFNQVCDPRYTNPDSIVPGGGYGDDAKIVRFSGLLQSFETDSNDPNVYVLSATSLEKELDRDCFAVLKRMTALSEIKEQTPTGTGITYLVAVKFDSNTYAVNDKILCRVEDEIMCLQVYDVSWFPRCTFLGRGLCGTKQAHHDIGVEINEIIPVIEQRASGSYMEQTSKFSSTPTAVSPLHADHPIIILLQILLSTGSGTNTDGSRNYDVLPKDWGMGLSYKRVNFTEILAAAQEQPALRFGGVVEKPENFVAFMRELLVFAGYYFNVTLGDQLTIRKLRPPLPGASTKAINNGTRIRGNFSSWAANWQGAIRELTFKFGYDIVSTTYKRVVVQLLSNANVYSKGLARGLEFTSRFIYPGGTGIPGEPPFKGFDVDAWLLDRSDFYNLRYSKPPPIVVIRVDFSFLGTEVGDLVTVTHALLPNVAGGARGLTASVAEVIGKAIDDGSKTIELTLLMTGYSLGQYRYIAPSLKLNPGHWSVAAGVLHLTNIDTFNDYSSFPDDDGNYFDGSGASQLLWPTGRGLKLWSSDFQNSKRCDWNDSDPDFLKVTPHGGGVSYAPVTPADGCIITFDTYDNVFLSGTDPRTLFAWLSNNGAPETIGGAALDRAHKLFPG